MIFGTNLGWASLRGVLAKGFREGEEASVFEEMAD
jgi:hypothetical protein